jgi:hypothetical protein
MLNIHLSDVTTEYAANQGLSQQKREFTTRKRPAHRELAGPKNLPKIAAFLIRNAVILTFIAPQLPPGVTGIQHTDQSPRDGK